MRMRFPIFFVLLLPSIASAQDLVCCGKIFIRADGDWIGAPRDCEVKIPALPEDKRAKACAQIFAADPACGAAMKGCDCAAVDALLKADYERWMSVRRDQAAAADEMRDETTQAIRRGKDAMLDQAKEDLWAELPIAVMTYTAGSEEDAAEIAMKVLEEAAEKADVEKGLVQRATVVAAGAAKVADFLLDWGITLKKVDLSLGEADRYSGQGSKASDAAQQATRKAYEIWKQREAAEKACKEQRAKRLDGAPPDPKEFDDDVQIWRAVSSEIKGAIEANQKAIAGAGKATRLLSTKRTITEKEYDEALGTLSDAFESEARAIRKLVAAEKELKRLDEKK